MIIYIRWLDLKQKKIREEFLGIVDLENGKAETIEKRLISFLEANGLDPARMVSFGSDGASAMTGDKSGVATRLRSKIPYLVCIHCCSHRFALVIVGATKTVEWIKNVYEPVLISLWAYLNFSSVRWSRFLLSDDDSCSDSCCSRV